MTSPTPTVVLVAMPGSFPQAPMCSTSLSLSHRFSLCLACHNKKTPSLLMETLPCRAALGGATRAARARTCTWRRTVGGAHTIAVKIRFEKLYAEIEKAFSILLASETCPTEMCLHGRRGRLLMCALGYKRCRVLPLFLCEQTNNGKGVCLCFGFSLAPSFGSRRARSPLSRNVILLYRCTISKWRKQTILVWRCLVSFSLASLQCCCVLTAAAVSLYFVQIKRNQMHTFRVVVRSLALEGPACLS